MQISTKQTVHLHTVEHILFHVYQDKVCDWPIIV